MALGAIPGDVLRIVLVRGLRLAALGIVFGLAAALALTRYLGSLHEEISAVDPMALASAAVIFAFVAAAAALLPRVRRRASTRPLRCGKIKTFPIAIKPVVDGRKTLFLNGLPAAEFY